MSGALLTIEDVRGKERVEDVADVVIIGTGAAGAPAGRVLTEAGLDVVFIEEGPPMPAAGARRADSWSTFRHYWRDASFQVARGRGFTPVLQGRAVGGSTPINGAIIHRMPEAIHEVWARDWGAGEVLSYQALTRAWDTMDAELGVGPTPEEIWGGNNRLMAAGVVSMGATGAPTFRAARGCEGTTRCNQGCPNVRKQSMDVTYIPRAIEAGARVYATCRGEQFIVEGGRAAGVRGTFLDPDTGAPGPTLEVRARKAVIVAAGAIHSPLLLLDNGLGGRSKLVGKRFQCHPGSGIMALFDDPVQMWFGATQGYETKHWWSERMKFEVVGLPPAVATARLPGWGADFMAHAASLGHVAHWGVQVRAATHGRVRRPRFGRRPKITYDLVRDDVKLFKKGFLRLAHMAFGAGARAVLPGIHGLPEVIRGVDEMQRIESLPDDSRLFHSIVAHLFGTTTLGPDERRSVVKPDGESWELPGLYVVDASVFPTNMGVNPQHTISAVAWLMAERLADRAA